MINSTILAIGTGTGKAGADAFWSSSIGAVLGAFLGVLGVIVVLIAIVKCIGHVTSGKPGAAVKLAIGALVVAAFLFNPEMLQSLVEIFGNIVSKVIESIGSISDKAK